MICKLRLITLVVITSISSILTGCAAFQSQNDLESGKLIVAPSAPNYKIEVTIARLNNILSSNRLTPQQRAKFYYERGVLYDRTGLSILSRIDFYQALKLQPDMAEAYNFIGIYYTQEGIYENAYEAFDSALELSPDNDFAHFNRGIALYYDNRSELALADMQSFFKTDPQDGYRALWLYIVELSIDAKQAQADLSAHRTKLDDAKWATAIVDYYLGDIDLKQLFVATKQDLSYPEQYTERLCEAYFYIAKKEQEQHKDSAAANYYRLALATNVYDFVEYRYAGVELAKLNKMQKH